MDLACAQLKKSQISYSVQQILAKIFNPESEFNKKNRNKPWDRVKWEGEFGPHGIYGVIPANEIWSYGPLINFINQFAFKDGFQNMSIKFQTTSLSMQVFSLF